MTELINTIDQTFNFNDNTIRVLVNYNEPWFVAKDICDILQLSNVTNALRNIPEKWMSLQNVKSTYNSQNMCIISEPAVYKLIMRSNKPIALKFQEFVCEDILPTIRKTGEYKLKQLSEKNQELQHELSLKEKELELSWITKFNKKSVVYIGFIGIIEDKNYYKFGWTDDIQRRTNDHKNDYGTFNLQYVLECVQNIVLEQKLKDHKEIKKVRCSRIFKQKNRTELIILNNKFTIENVKTILKKLKASIDENEYISIKHKEKIMQLENKKIELENKKIELMLNYSCQSKDKNIESSLFNTKIEDKIEDKVEDKVEDNNQIEFIDEEIEFVLEDDDIDDEDDDTEYCILRKCNICNIDKKLTKFSKCININTYRLTCKQCVNEKKEMEKAKVKYTKIKGVKHFWSQEETEILLKAVLTYGTKWSKILKNNPILVENNRSQIDLKDKYRNILKSKKYIHDEGVIDLDKCKS